MKHHPKLVRIEKKIVDWLQFKGITYMLFILVGNDEWISSASSHNSLEEEYLDVQLEEEIE